ncbi:ABC-type xenobiotic transporter [Heracleum sosnowskyi]|uniref:ABC-type xenobiotic transporter n=1 Tax=Heracleum sosnowskyi TaxID=360622 RepID=A0AAD8HFJ3_9APIA|nr:ABC-type xenobiotic transporter [Heracleum sosnowskyi]
MWPLVLILWWFFYGLLHLLMVFLYFDKIQSSTFVSKPNFVDIASFPLSILLCLTAFSYPYKRASQVQEPLLQKTTESEASVIDDAFSKAGIWSKLTFRWLNPLFKKGRVKKIELSDIPSIPQSEAADNAASLLEESLSKQKNQASLLPNAIFKAIWKPLAVNAIFAGVNTIASYVGPFLITNFVNFLSNKDDNSSSYHGLILPLIFLSAKTVESLSQRQWYFGAQRIGIRVRAALTVLLYKKSLSIKYSGNSTGKIINCVSVDVDRIGDFCWYVHGIWLLPVQVALALVILYRNLGAAPSFAALFATILVMVSNTPLANKQESLHSKIMEAKDSRIKATSETLKSMRVLKLHSWEPTFMEKILQLRETERSWLKKYLYTCSAVAFLFWASPTLVSVVTFGVCIVLKTPLSSGTVLSALATFRILQEPIYNLPELISMVAQTKVSVDRIHDFICEQENMQLEKHPSKDSNIAIELEQGEYAWDENDQYFESFKVKISDKIRIRKGYKVAICGSVGSGKSSLLCSILGEIPKISGNNIKVYGSKAFVPQSAWIQTGTIRENILFGKELDMTLYKNVVEGCALTRDIEMWADGDLSVVGERGMNLSGGQKQRIQLARAIYNESDVYFLDDPFSAVDAHTGAHMFKKCMMELLNTKTVIYVTHQLEFLEASDLVLVMKNGRIVQSGKYKDLIAETTGELVTQMAAHSKSLNQVKPPKEFNKNYSSKGYHQENQSEVEVIEEKVHNFCHRDGIPEKSQQEETETGRVKWHVYSTFATCAYRGALVPLILLCQVLFQALQMASNYWIAWGTEEEDRGMITSVFRAPLSFFDSTPSSRILNRSSTDQSIVDTDIPYRLAGLAFALIQLLSIVVLMSNVAWQISILFLIVLAISIWYQAYYITTARELARMVGIRKAPILHHFSESISGASTIRCFNQEDRFMNRNISLIDDYSRVAFHNSSTMEWLCVRINFLFNLVFFLLLVILVNLPRSAIDPSLAGLAVTYGLNLNVLQAWVIWNLCNVENKMISVERILQYTKIPSEAPLVIENSRPEPNWPINGKIELQNLHVQYTPSLPKVLKGITCTFQGQMKIGVVGRTGSGKSTLIQALFRVVEPTEGQILIDGVNISSMGLHDLRSRLSIIPQDPTLFQGTMRSNLDPLQQHLNSDQEIWEVLNKCQLAEGVRQDQRQLDAPVAEDGENWSVGQRQLVCLARVLLQKRKILVLDEATASVDTATDNVIQKTIRNETSNCTVITVAHRIPTVIDNDLVLVLDEGNILEYDSPAQLLKDSSSAFSNLVAEFTRRSTKG